jgi:hypothetical protein
MSTGLPVRGSTELATRPSSSKPEVRPVAPGCSRRNLVPVDKANSVAEKPEQQNPRACEKWSEADDAALAEMVRGGATVTEIAHRLQRNRGAIQSRIATLSLTESPRQ